MKILNFHSSGNFEEIDLATAFKGVVLDNGSLKEVTISGTQKLIALSADGHLVEFLNEPATTSVNVALASNGATTPTGQPLGGGFPASAPIDGDRRGIGWGAGGGWANGGPADMPGVYTVVFNDIYTIREIGVFTIQDNYGSPADPTEDMVFSAYGITGCYVEYNNGGTWEVVTGTTVTNNFKVWKRFILSTPILTDKIRLIITASPDGFARLIEFEAWI